MSWPRKSLWRQLLGPLLSLWLMSALVAALAAYWLVGRASGVSFDHFLQDDALALGTQVQWSDGQARFVADENTAASLVFDSLSRLRYVVRTGSGRTLIGNAMRSLPSRWSAPASAPASPVFFDIDSPDGALRAVAVRLSSAPGDEPVEVIVAELKTARERASREIALAIFVPAALVGFIIVPLIHMGIRRGLSSTRDISKAVAQRGIDDLSPLPVDDVPDELRALVRHTNELLHRLDDAVTEQRRFVSDAAHQLQTPVAGIRLLVSDMRRTQRADPGQPADAEVLHQLEDVAGRTAHLVHQLLAFARVDRDAEIEDVAFDPAELVATVSARWAAPVAAAGKTLRACDPAHKGLCTVTGSPTLFSEVIGNLIDNAKRYGGPHITTGLSIVDGWVCLSICDDGPPLDASTLENMFRPFWRGSHGAPDGSGLGLSIVQRVLARMGGTVAVRSGAHAAGTCIEIRLPCKANEKLSLPRICVSLP